MEEQDNRKQLNACDMNFKGNYLRQKGWGRQEMGSKIKEDKSKQSIMKMS